MSLKNLLRILPKSGSLSSFSRIPATARFSTNNKQNKQEDDSDLRQKETEFIQKGNLDFTGIQMNMENIRRKQAQGRDKELPLGNYKLKRPSQFYDPQKNPNPTASVFNFHEEDLLQKSNLIQIYGLSNGYFTANDVWYPGSIIAFPKQIFLWDVQSAADIRPHSFDILDVIKPTPNYVIIGTGKDMYPLEESIFVRFRERGIKVDVIPTFEACSTYNVCNEDLLNMCAFLIPANL